MTNQTKSTPLDTLKQTAKLVEELLDIIIDDFGGKYGVDDDDEAYAIAGSISMELTKALAAHVPGISWDQDVAMRSYDDPAARQAIQTFDDGTPIWRLMDHGGFVSYYYPRRDGTPEEHAQRMAALKDPGKARHLHAVTSTSDPGNPGVQVGHSGVFPGSQPVEPSGNWTGAETVDNIDIAVQRLNAAAEPTNAEQHIEVMAGLAEWQFDAEALAAVGVADERVARDLVNLLHAATHAVRGDVDPSIIVQSVGIIGGRIAHRIAGVER
ncbi:hypothetical protein SAMN06295974_0334 [Plantibacter flavus]|uniref:Uncharacterized protein n=1 Tax=Plantibacter flavus TaxID=150123 RepID=A0A3N2C0X8_9MICO|nr:hypothetical protein [Plantibacter flavus]ROR81110.1 hypothetical protein EDD42_1161 [Plantibacter flavus]SMG07961.1 hypothetical protein SAMN06295974_0334 [Plantibacter flavus]